MAIRHQQITAFRGFSYKDELLCGLKSDFDKDDWELYGSLFDEKAKSNIKKVKYFVFNHYKYKSSYFMIHDNQLFEIQKIVLLNEKIWFVSRLFSIVKFDEFFHSYKVVASNETYFELICFDEISNKKPYEKKNIENDFYIMADNFDVNIE